MEQVNPCFASSRRGGLTRRPIRFIRFAVASVPVMIVARGNASLSMPINIFPSSYGCSGYRKAGEIKRFSHFYPTVLQSCSFQRAALLLYHRFVSFVFYSSDSFDYRDRGMEQVDIFSEVRRLPATNCRNPRIHVDSAFPECLAVLIRDRLRMNKITRQSFHAFPGHGR